MSTDLTKMVENWYADRQIPEHSNYSLTQVLKALAAEIEGNTENLGHAARTCENLDEVCNILSERIDILKDRIERLEHLEKRVEDAEDRHRNLLQSLEDNDLPRP